MGIADDMKKLREEILESYKKRAEEYQQRLKENETLVVEVQKTLDGFRKSHLEMAANLQANAATLRSNLNQGEIARLKAFGDLMTGIGKSISTIQKEVEDIQNSTTNLLAAFSRSRGEMAEGLNKKFAQARAGREKQNQDRLKDFDNLMKNIQEDIDRSKASVDEILTGAENLIGQYASERQEMSTTLRRELNANLEDRVAFTRELLKTFHDRLTEIGNENRKMGEMLREKLLQSREDLSASDEKRMKDFDQAMGKIRSRVTDIQSSIANLITNLSKDRMHATAEWQSLAEAIAQIKTSSTKAPRSKTVVQAPDVVIARKEVKKEKTAVKEEKAAPVEKKVAEFQKEMSLEEKIIAYVNAHPEGVKVSEMEEPLGEQRMRIGYVCKKLLDAGKLTKLEKAYFPKAKDEKKDK